jgi:serine/threonine protein kinase
MSRTLQPEDQISHYRVVGPLGAGGMGEVYIAKDETLERSVAIKVLPTRLVRNEERVRRFITEAKSASGLNHPNIVTIYEIGHDTVRASQTGDGADEPSEPVHFISMELVTGETLTQMIHTERADLRTLVGYLAQAAEGVSKAHAAGIVHRDLKPGNIMISRDGFAKVLDFGLAKLTEKQAAADEDLTSAPTEMAQTGEGVIMGTVGYMSPEQVQGKGVDHRSDIFSLGCILYEAATRKRPFVADTDVEVMHQILRDNPHPVEAINPETPAEIRRIIRRCLAKSPDQRFQSMKDVAIDLREAVADWESLSASATSASSGISSGSGAFGVPAGRSTAFWSVIGAAAVLGIGGLAFGIYSFMSSSAGGSSFSASAQNLSISVLMSRNDLRETALSGDGRYLAYVTASDQATALTVRQVRTGSDVTIVPESEFFIRGVSFSNDGDYLYYLNNDPDSPNYSALFQVPSLGGTPRKIFFDVDTAASFSPDGKRAVFRRGMPDRNADALMIGMLESGEEKELVRVEDPLNFSAAPAWSPDGSRIAVVVRTPAGGVQSWIEVVDVESGERTRVGSGSWLAANSLGWLPDGSAILVSAFDFGRGTGSQIYRVGYPEGGSVRMTNDLDGYGNISLSADGSTIAAVRRSAVRNLWVSPPDAHRDAEPITFASGSTGSVGNLTPLPGGEVAFTAPRDNNTYVWSMNADGSGRRQLTSQGIFVLDVSWAKGAGIVFSQVESGEKPLAHVWRMNSDGSGLEQLTNGDGEQQRNLSPVGTTFLFSRWEEPDSAWIFEFGGGGARRVGENIEFASISWDGRRLLYTKLEQVEGKIYPRQYLAPVEGGDPLATFLLPPGATNLQWSPDGESLTYVDRQKGWNLWRKPLPDGEPEAVTRFTDGQVVDHNWHADGSRLVLHRRVNRQDSLWELKTGEHEPTLITEFKTGQIEMHRWAPDDETLYFTYGDSSQDVVMLSNFR